MGVWRMADGRRGIPVSLKNGRNILRPYKNGLGNPASAQSGQNPFFPQLKLWAIIYVTRGGVTPQPGGETPSLHKAGRHGILSLHRNRIYLLYKGIAKVCRFSGQTWYSVPTSQSYIPVIQGYSKGLSFFRADMVFCPYIAIVYTCYTRV